MGEIIERTVPDAPLEWTGERLTSAARGQVEIEHLHRYLLARQLARGLDVLDVASGEGYGSAFIAQTARSVTGIEIDSAAAQHAARSYQAPNLRFLEGDARALPLRDASMDLVVSFETIEHFHEHERFLAEVRRVLRPGGRLLISSPDRCIYSPPGAAPNPFHARELSESEFEALLRRHFRLVLLQGQRTVLGSALIGRSASGGGLLTFERQAGGYEASDGLPGPIYVIALASDSEAMLLPDSLLIETSALEPALTELPALRTLSERRQTALDAAGEYARRLEAGLAEHDHAAAAAQSEARALQRRVDELAAESAARASALATLEARLPALEAELRRSRQADADSAARLQAVLTSASWRATLPLRAMLAHSPGLRRVARRTARAMWWAATLQLPQRLASRRAARTPVLGPQASAPHADAAPASAPAPATAPLAGRALIAEQAAESLRAFLASGERLQFAASDMADVSVLIVVWNKAYFTLRCLRALLGARVRLEVIVVDNASTDDTPALLDRVDGIRVIRNATNEGFLLATNRAASVATGRNLLLLNNDAFVRAGSIAAALATLHAAADIGAVGGRLVRPDERLQEAGSIVYSDGSTFGYARDADTEAGEAMFRRDVDYCSGAFLLTPRAVWERLGGFDATYAPAYYEEADYCMRLREAGLRTVYEPDAVIDHFEFGSEARQGEAVALTLRNRKRFRDRHAARLLADHFPPVAGNMLAARNAATGRTRRLLVIDDVVPLAALGSGWPRAREILAAAVAAGWSVTLYPTSQDAVDWPATRREIPAEVEIIVNGGGPGLGSFLASRAGFFDTILVSRPHNMTSLRKAAGHVDLAAAGTRVIYDAEALFSLREAEQARVRGTPKPPSELQALIESELTLCAGADAVLCVTAAEAAVFREHLPNVPAESIHVLSHPTAPRAGTPDFDARGGFLFVGRLKEKDAPNWDGLAWFVASCWPLIRDLLPEAILTVAGHVHADTQEISGPGIRILGPVDDLAPLYDAARVFIAPVRFAAGIPIKILEATAAGLPCAGTRLMARQMNFTPDVDMVAEDAPQSLARGALSLHANAAAWRAMRDAAMHRIAREHGAQAFRASLLRALGDAGRVRGQA